MPDIKSIACGAAIGFLFSLIIGLFSDVNFGIMIFRAFIFAVCGGVLGFGAKYVFEKFLDSPGTSYSDSTDGEGYKRSAAVPGGTVDIVVEDENLPEDSDSPKFEITQNSAFSSQIGNFQEQKNEPETSKTAAIPAENNVPVKSENPPSEPSVPASDVKPASFQSFNMAESAEKIKTSSAENAQPVSPVSQSPVQSMPQNPPQKEETSVNNRKTGGNAVENELDVLPDIGNLNFNSKKNENSDIIRDSEFASNSSSSGGEVSGNSNTAEMAMAIRTLLAKDNK